MANAKQAGNLAVRTVAVKLTDDGRERDHNEDCVGILIPSKMGTLQTMGALHLVADGMGGHQAGEGGQRGGARGGYARVLSALQRHRLLIPG